MPDRETGEGRWSDERLLEAEVSVALGYLKTRVSIECAREARVRDKVELSNKALNEAERRFLLGRR